MITNTTDDGFCCAMRRYFVVGIIAEADGDAPPEVVDFMIEFDPPTIAIRYCPFCGSRIDPDSLRLPPR